MNDVLSADDLARTDAMAARASEHRERAERLASHLSQLYRGSSDVRDFLTGMHALIAVEKARCAVLDVRPPDYGEILHDYGVLNADGVMRYVRKLREARA
jgi:hypothetical protein